MPEPSVYRRIPPFLWDKKKDRPQPAAFFIRDDEEELSVFDTSIQTPRGVLENFIENAQQLLNSTDEAKQNRGRQLLSKHGDTVEALVRNGWRVVRLPVTAFTDVGFTLDGPEPNGHRNVIGEREDFKTHSLSWIDAEVLSDEEVLQNPGST